MTSPQAILRLATLRDIESRQRDAQPPLMERAGQAAAVLASDLLSGLGQSPLIVAGPGNNGGDAFVVARLLKQKGIIPTVVFCGSVEKLPLDARTAYGSWISNGGTSLEDIPTQAAAPALVIDGLFGIGLTRPLAGPHARLVDRINAFACPVLALDIPSGLDSETGHIMGTAVRATHTATFIGLKPGLLTMDGPDYSGSISVHDLGLKVCPSDGCLIAPQLFAEQLGPRRRNSHKGSYGSVGILGGSPGMTGAALLAGRAALHLGTGRVYVGLLESDDGITKRPEVDPAQPELMLRESGEVIDLATALVIGPGLGKSRAALKLIHDAIRSPLPLLLDADALNLIAQHPVLARNLSRRSHPSLLTPHPAEAARLLGADIASVQADRIGSAQKLAERYRAATLLKGCGSVIALPDGRWFINSTGNPGLASAGTGDVLSGMIVALLAQSWPSERALLAATHLHGAAADACVATGAGPIGLTAGELILAARKLLNHWIAIGQ
ncbi:MAG: NAD(P)H-hydrate dehydratase [Betaproteobacteria bacterium]|nr:NAD(P)H-hydrate dehydratase [Betaproteobacteria bacterium]